MSEHLRGVEAVRESMATERELVLAAERRCRDSLGEQLDEVRAELERVRLRAARAVLAALGGTPKG